MDTFTTITRYVSSTSDLSDFLPLSVWLLFARKNRTYLILGIYFLLAAFIKLFTFVTAEYHIHNMPAYHLLAVVEITMIFSFYSQLIFKRVYIWTVIFLLLFSLADSVFLEPCTTFNSISWTVDMMVLIIMGVTYLYKLYSEDSDVTPLEQRPDFMITTGWLLYAAGSLFSYLFGSATLSGKAEGFYNNAWIFQCVSNLFKNTIISYGLWRAR